MKNVFAAARCTVAGLSVGLLKKKLGDSDYKIIKCAECSLAGLDAPYDIAALHMERQALRDRINALEAGAVSVPE